MPEEIAPQARHPNHDAVAAFLEQIPMKRPICRTDRIDGTKVANGYFAAYATPDGSKGFTAVSFDAGQFAVYFERVTAPGKVQVTKHGNVNADAATVGCTVAALI